MTITILSVGVLAFVGAFLNMSRSIQTSKTRSIAGNLVQEKIETMKNISYYRLVVTTAPALSSEPGLTAYLYDEGYYPEETMNVAGVNYTRRVFVERVSMGATGPVGLSAMSDDTGLKRIKAYVIWKDAESWKMVSMENLKNTSSTRRLTAVVAGVVKSTTNQVQEGATVSLMENAGYFATSDSGGEYSFKVEPGTYSLQARKYGYFPMTETSVYLSASSTHTWNPQLPRMSSGNVMGCAYLRDHLVISQVVGSSITIDTGDDQEYIELFNPTTYTIQIAAGPSAPYIDLYWDPESGSPSVIPLVFTNLSVAPSSYYLIANYPTIKAGGLTRAADAVYDPSASGYPNIITVAEDPGAPASGGVGLAPTGAGSWLTAEWIDRFGWRRTANLPQLCEDESLDQAIGLSRGEQFVRRTSSNSISLSVGRAYDSNNNDHDFVNLSGAAFIHPPRNTTDLEAPQTGTPAAGAYVAADDLLSGPVTCASDGTFILSGVSTGTWRITFSSMTYFMEMSTSVSSGQQVQIGRIGITSSTLDGFITGTVYNTGNVPIPDIEVSGLGSTPGVTDSNGRYKLTGATGTVTVVANGGNQNSLYVSMSSASVLVELGRYTAGVDFFLPSGGRIRGLVRIGSSPLPDIPVTASTNSVVVREAVTDSDGYFTIQDLSTGTYTVDLQLEQGETYSPGPLNITIPSAGTTVFASTYTVSNAFGWISGSLTQNGQNIQTGVLIIATTGTITGAPPAITSTLRGGVQKYYSVSSFADGTYRLSVPGGNPGTPVAYNVYGYYTTFSGATPTIWPRSTTANVTGGQETTGRNLSW
ncbi:MAG TPA: carboxypeptidase-like regulatory domain-containing protein [Elusimicrobiota bacterium]|nr:carboxypeptidase-like regulatory domain-containing protein [Elusimicrobiota bacterium]